MTVAIAMALKPLGALVLFTIAGFGRWLVERFMKPGKLKRYLLGRLE